MTSALVQAAAASTGDPAALRVRRVLVVNPNTNPAVTALVAQACAPHAGEHLHFDVVNPSQGPFSIENAAQRDAAERQVLALVEQRRRLEHHDAYVTACFDDLALAALRARVDVPVIGTCEAGITAVRALTPRFVIVTTVPDAVAGIGVMMRRYGAGALATVRAAGLGVAQAAAADAHSLDRLVDTVMAAVREDGACAVLLASGGLTGRADALSRATGLPVVDGVGAAVAQAAAHLRSVSGAPVPRQQAGVTDADERGLRAASEMRD
ncbi:MAG: aspartate/glutamate racemase family protein [Rubrivivax sp.]